MNRFEIAKHYEVASSDDSIVIKEYEVVLRDNKIYWWHPATGLLTIMAAPHMKSASEAYSDWKERATERLHQYERAIVVLEKQLAHDCHRVTIVKET